MNIGQQILINTVKKELTRLLEHEPTAEEYKSFIDYCNDNCDYETATVEDLLDTMSDWRDDNCTQCEACGQYHLTEEMQKEEEGYFCDNHCYDSYCYDVGIENINNRCDDWKMWDLY